MTASDTTNADTANADKTNADNTNSEKVYASIRFLSGYQIITQ